MYHLNLPDDLKEAAEMEKRKIRKMLRKDIKFPKRSHDPRSSELRTSSTEDGTSENFSVDPDTSRDSDQVVCQAPFRNDADGECDDSDESNRSYTYLSAWAETDAKKWLYGDAESHQWEVSIRLQTPENTCKGMNEILLHTASNAESPSSFRVYGNKTNENIENAQKFDENVETCKQNPSNGNEMMKNPDNSPENSTDGIIPHINNFVPNDKTSRKSKATENIKYGRSATLTILSRRPNVSQEMHFRSANQKKRASMDDDAKSKHCEDIEIPENQAIEEIIQNEFDLVNTDQKQPLVAEVCRSQTKQINQLMSINAKLIQSGNTAEATPVTMHEQFKTGDNNSEPESQPVNQPRQLASLLAKIVKAQSDKTQHGVLHSTLLQTNQPQVFHQPEYLRKDLRKLLNYFAIRGRKVPICAERIWLPQCFTEMLNAQEAEELEKCMRELQQSVPSTSEDFSDTEIDRHCSKLVNFVNQSVCRAPFHKDNNLEHPKDISPTDRLLEDILCSPTKSLAPEQAHEIESAQTALIRTPESNAVQALFELHGLTINRTIFTEAPNDHYEEDEPMLGTIIQRDSIPMEDRAESEIDIIFPPEKSLAVEQARQLESARAWSVVRTPDVGTMQLSFEMRELGLNKVPSADPESVFVEEQQLPTSSVFQLLDSPIGVDGDDVEDVKLLSARMLLEPLYSPSPLDHDKNDGRLISPIACLNGMCGIFGGAKHQKTNLVLPKLCIKNATKESKPSSSPGGDLKYLKQLRRPRSALLSRPKHEGKKSKKLLEFFAKKYQMISGNHQAKQFRPKSAEELLLAGSTLNRRLILRLTNRDAWLTNHQSKIEISNTPTGSTSSQAGINSRSVEPNSESTFDENCPSSRAESISSAYDARTKISTPILDLHVGPANPHEGLIPSGLILVQTDENISKEELVFHLQGFVQRAQRNYDIRVLTSSAGGRHVVYLQPEDNCAPNIGATECQNNVEKSNGSRETALETLETNKQSMDFHSHKLDNGVTETMKTQSKASQENEEQFAAKSHITA